jgi:hypothetical protein
VGLPLAALLAWGGREVHVLADAARHLLTVGFMLAVVIAMLFRLVPVLERVALPWPRLRALALWALAGAVILRTGEVAVAAGATALAPAVAASGALAWVALAAVAANLLGALAGARATRRP